MKDIKAKIDKLRVKEKQLLEQINLLEQSDKQQERKLETRRKIIIGAAFRKAFEDGDIEKDFYFDVLRKNIRSSGDKKLLDFLGENND